MTFKLIILENALTTWDQSETREVVCDLVALKTEGYGRAFNDPLLVIPLDVFEFVGNHVLLYKDDELVMGYKSVFLHDCLKMNLDFPLNNAVKNCGSEDHKAAYNEFFGTNKNNTIAYDCHLTVSNRVSKNPELLYECLSILHALAFHYRHEYEVDFTFMLGTYFAGTQKTFQKMGAKAFSGLGSITLATYDKREALIMLCDKNFSAKTTEFAGIYESLWRSRKVINVKYLEKKNAA